MNLVRQERGDSICPYCHRFSILIFGEQIKEPSPDPREDIGEMCGTTPDRVYQIAHGSHIRNYEDSVTLTELKRRGIVRD